MSAPTIGTLELPDHSPARPVSSFAHPGANDGSNSSVKAWDESKGPSFSDVLDVLNPLQHIPLVNTVYRNLTGDREGAVADVVGGTLYGGFIGLGLSVAGLTVQDATGVAPDDYAYASLFGEGEGSTVSSTAVASAKSAPTDLQTAQSSVSQASAGDDEDAPPPPAAAPRDTVTQVKSGPVKSGDYLIFGATQGASASGKQAQADVAQQTAQAVAAAQPVRAAAPQPVKQTAQAIPQTAQQSAQTASVTPTSKQGQVANSFTTQGDYMVFGGSSPLAAAVQSQSVQTAQATQAAQSQAAQSQALQAQMLQALNPLAANQVASAQATNQAATQTAMNDKAAFNALTAANAESSPLQSTLQQQSSGRAGDAKMMPLPTRRNTVTPSATLPLPTTGPGAVPGGKPQAHVWSSNPTAGSTPSNDWFADTFNKNLDKMDSLHATSTYSTASQTNAAAIN